MSAGPEGLALVAALIIYHLGFTRENLGSPAAVDFRRGPGSAQATQLLGTYGQNSTARGKPT